MAILHCPPTALTRFCPVLKRPWTECLPGKSSTRLFHPKNTQAGQKCPACFISHGNGSDPHRHHDVTVLVFAIRGFVRAQLAGGLRILELEADIARTYHLEKFQEIL